MKIIILTNETFHHAFFVKAILSEYDILNVIVERDVVRAPFKTHHPFEDARNEYERQVFFNGKDVRLKDISDVYEVDNINDAKVVDLLEKCQPDVVIVFGTRKILKRIINTCPFGIVNLHGGDPEAYRGLDSHLWSIYHDDFNLIVTLHSVNEKLDDGNIILQKPVSLSEGILIHELRRYNTEICIDLVLSGLDMYKRYGYYISRPQRTKGRYYSFMPSELKDICVNRFNRYVERNYGSSK